MDFMRILDIQTHENINFVIMVMGLLIGDGWLFACRGTFVIPWEAGASAAFISSGQQRVPEDSDSKNSQSSLDPHP